MGDGYEPDADHVLAALAHESVAAGFILAAQLESDAADCQDQRIADLYLRMARYIEANSLIGQHVTGRQSMTQMALSFAAENVNAILRRLAKIESREDGSRLRDLGAGVFRWRPFERFFDTLRLKSVIAERDVQIVAAHHALVMVESRLSVMHKWEREAIDAAPGAVPHSQRLDAIAMALIEVIKARADCEIREEVE